MRLVLAALMAVTLAVVTTTDRVACFDGCTDEAQHESPSTTASVCGLCHGWNGPLAADVAAPIALPVVTVAPPASPELPAHFAPIDHPPRLA